jgi:hypothetical protein
MQAAPVNYRALFAIGSIGFPLAGILTSVTTVACCRFINKISLFVYREQQKVEPGSWQEIACKAGRVFLYLTNVGLSAFGFAHAALLSGVAFQATVLLAGNVPLLFALAGVTLTVTSLACTFLLGCEFVPHEVLSSR